MSLGRLGGAAGAVGASVFVLVFLVEGWIRPGYSPLAEYVSALSLGPRGWVQIASFVVTGVCLSVFALALARVFPAGAASRAGPVLLGIIALGLLLSGPLVMDPAGTPQNAMSGHGLTHGILGAIVFVLMPITPFVYLRRFGREAAWRPLWWPTLVLAVLTATADVVFTITSKVPDLAVASAPWTGLLQRLVLTPFMVWVALFGLRLATSPVPESRHRSGGR